MLYLLQATKRAAAGEGGHGEAESATGAAPEEAAANFSPATTTNSIESSTVECPQAEVTRGRPITCVHSSLYCDTNLLIAYKQETEQLAAAGHQHHPVKQQQQQSGTDFSVTPDVALLLRHQAAHRATYHKLEQQTPEESQQPPLLAVLYDTWLECLLHECNDQQITHVYGGGRSADVVTANLLLHRPRDGALLDELSVRRPLAAAVYEASQRLADAGTFVLIYPSYVCLC